MVVLSAAMYLRFILVLSLCIPLAATAQEMQGGVTPSGDPALPLIPESAVQGGRSFAAPEQSLMPDAPVAPEKRSKTEVAEDALQGRIRYRQAKTKAIRDPKVISELARADAALTDQERRDALKSHYKLLFARMEKLDKTLKPQLELRSKNALGRLTQVRMEPTQRLETRSREIRYDNFQE